MIIRHPTCQAVWHTEVASGVLYCYAKVPCAVSDGTAWNFSAWAGDGPHGRNFMCRSLLPVIVVRPRHMKFFARRGSDQKMRVENTGIQRYKEVRRKRLPFPQGQRQPDVNYILAVSFSLPGRDGTEFFYLSFMRLCGAADFTCGSCKTAWRPRSHRESPGCLGGRTPPRERRCSGIAGRDRRCRSRRGTPCRAGSSRIPG